MAVGRLREGITYILIATWSDDTMLDAAYEALGEADATKGLIVDVRPNGGGSEPLAQKFAGLFRSTPPGSIPSTSPAAAARSRRSASGPSGRTREGRSIAARSRS